MLGDPQQLPQVSQGKHPEPVNESVLSHLLGDKKTMPDDVSSEPDGVESLADRLIKNCRVR